jgi:molybdenum cofactor biosynthesis enzyme MoaA
MVCLPARLTSKLAKARIAQIFNSASPGPLLHCVDPVEILHAGAAAPVSREKMEALLENPAPVIWICGSEPLLHAGIGHFVRAIAQSGHCVFLETGGTSLRRRIHEFQPQPELFLSVRLDSLQAPESTLTLEGLRAARLSGFLTVIHSTVHEDLDSEQLTTLRSFIAEKDVDGWLITAASRNDAAVRKAAEARRLIRSSFWRQFSKHVDEALRSQTPARESHDAEAFVAESLHTEAGEEGVRIA